MQRKRPYVPKPDEGAVRRGLPSTRRSYIKDGVPVYRHKDGKNRIRFLAWKEKVHFAYYLYIHQRVGVNEDSFACLAKNWKEPDPLCEDAQDQMAKGATWDDVQQQGILPGKWPRYLVQIVDRDHEEQGVQVWDVTSFGTDDSIRSLSVDDDTGAVISWTDPDNGYDLIYEYDSKAQYPMPKNLRRSSQPTKLSAEFYEGIMDFDADIIYKPTYDEMKKAYTGLAEEMEPAEEPTDDEAPLEGAAEGSVSEEEGDPLAGFDDCYGRAFGYYDDCAEEHCEDYERCKKAQKWTGESCPTCGLPLYEVKEGITCALEHLQKKAAPSPRRRRPIH